MKITWEFRSTVEPDILAQRTQARRLISPPGLGHRRSARRLAVVGGGPSVAEEAALATLKAWDGTIWAINGAFRWLAGHGITSVFFSTDPAPGIAELAKGADHAIFASSVHPSAWDVVSYAEMLELGFEPGQIMHGPTSATTAILAGIEAGAREISFFGCEGSYPGGRTHAYMTEKAGSLEVESNGERFLTKPEMLEQSLYLSEVIRAAPHLYKDCSGGLLGALVASGDHDIVAASPEIHAAINRRSHDSHTQEETA
jgi:hypothetical protein